MFDTRIADGKGSIQRSVTCVHLFHDLSLYVLLMQFLNRRFLIIYLHFGENSVLFYHVAQDMIIVMAVLNAVFLSERSQGMLFYFPYDNRGFIEAV